MGKPVADVTVVVWDVRRKLWEARPMEYPEVKSTGATAGECVTRISSTIMSAADYGEEVRKLSEWCVAELKSLIV